MSTEQRTNDEQVPVDARIAVLGLGYVGLPLSLELAEAGFQVKAVDTAQGRLAALRAGESYIEDVPGERIVAAVAAGTLAFADTRESWGDETAAFVCVPTPITSSHAPDLTAVLAAAEYLRQGLRAGDLVVLQSTTYPGTTMGPFREVLDAGGSRAGHDFDLAFAPERVNPGDRRPASTIPRLVGGINRRSAERTAAILGRISPSVAVMSTPDAAELTKLFENVFRNVNIALVNELALMCERLGLDVWEVIDGASSKPFGFMPFYPGPGVGGHCIPVDPYYMAARAREVGFHERFIETAGDINSQMPYHVLDLVTRALNGRSKAVAGSHIHIVGVAFKPDVSDARNTPASAIVRGLQELGGRVTYTDPHVPRFCPLERSTCARCMSSEPLESALRNRPDCVVIVTPHSGTGWETIVREADLIVDTRNATRGQKVRPAQVLRLGAGWS